MSMHAIANGYECAARYLGRGLSLGLLAAWPSMTSLPLSSMIMKVLSLGRVVLVDR
jgi:hypothetical protein